MDLQERKKLKNEQLGNGLKDNNGCSWMCLYFRTQNLTEPVISGEEKRILRELAKKVARISEEPVQEERRRLWTDHHSLKITRPLIFIDPEFAWYEILPHTVLECSNHLARLWEYRLRKEIFWQEVIGDDRVCTTYFPVGYSYTQSSIGLPPKRTLSKMAGGAYHIEPALTDWDDMAKLRFRELVIDYEKTEQFLALAHDVFDGVLDVQPASSWWYSDGITDELVNLRGFDNLLMDFYDYPDEVHALSAFLRDEFMHFLDFLENENLLSLNNGSEFVGTGGYGWCDELPGEDFHPDHVKLADMWGYGESQASVSISPEMFDEFILDYQVPILSRFGLNYYGCCEPMEKRFAYVKKKVPRLRTVAVAPWADRKSLAEQMRGDYVYCWKQNPARIAVEKPNWDVIRREIRETFELTAEYGCPTEVLMRDIRTLAYQEQNAAEWVRICREEAARVYGG